MGILWLFQSIFCTWDQLFACELNCWKVLGKKKEKSLLKLVVTLLWNSIDCKQM